MSVVVELYTAPGCPHCAAAREELEWQGVDFVEYDVSADPASRAHMLALTGGIRMVPVIAEPGKAVVVGWQGRGCPI